MMVDFFRGQQRALLHFVCLCVYLFNPMLLILNQLEVLAFYLAAKQWENDIS